MSGASRGPARRAPAPPQLEDDAAPGTLTADEPRAEGVRLTDPDLSSVHVRGLRLLDVAIERGNLANLDSPEPDLRRVAIIGARLTGVNWTRGRIADTVFRDCRIDLAGFAGTTFERVAFEGCMLSQADFRQALLRWVRFDPCDLTQADLDGLRIDRCELRGCTLDRLTGAERLRGAAMPWADVVGNAALFAAALGVELLDEE